MQRAHKRGTTLIFITKKTLSFLFAYNEATRYFLLKICFVQKYCSEATFSHHFFKSSFSRWTILSGKVCEILFFIITFDCFLYIIESHQFCQDINLRFYKLNLSIHFCSFQIISFDLYLYFMEFEYHTLLKHE